MGNCHITACTKKKQKLGIKEQKAGKEEQLKSSETAYTCRYTSGHLIPNSVWQN